jgi:hypothetical protein|eukprot:COSAG01_NODE_11183_length_1988_cov_3.456326_2_plen_85_part_00
MRDALKSKFEKMHEAVVQKDRDAEDMVREVSALHKQLNFATVAHDQTKQELADMSALRGTAPPRPPCPSDDPVVCAQTDDSQSS